MNNSALCSIRIKAKHLHHPEERIIQLVIFCKTCRSLLKKRYLDSCLLRTKNLRHS